MEGVFGLSVDRGRYQGTFSYDLSVGTFYQQHLQDENFGLAFYRSDEIRYDNHPGGLRLEDLKKILSNGFQGTEGIGYCGESSEDPRPESSRLGKFTISFSGKIINREGLVNELKKLGQTFKRESDSEIFAKLISQAEDFVDGIKIAMEKIRGSFVVLVLTTQGIYAARSPSARWELIIGEKKGAVALAFDPCGFRNLGFKSLRELKPSEVIFVGNGRIKESKIFLGIASREDKKVCSFLSVYTLFPNEIFGSNSVKVPVSLVRERLGIASARRDIKNGFVPDVVTWVPDSGKTHFVGYINEFIKAFIAGEIDRIPICKEIFYKYSHAGRSFTPSEKGEREIRNKIKLLITSENFRGKNLKIVVVDDSLVRGNQSRKMLEILKGLGFPEVHFRFSFPVIHRHCIWGKSTKKGEVLMNRLSSEEEIPEFFKMEGVKVNVGFNERNDLIKAIGLPEGKTCFDCIKY